MPARAGAVLLEEFRQEDLHGRDVALEAPPVDHRAVAAGADGSGDGRAGGFGCGAGERGRCRGGDRAGRSDGLGGRGVSWPVDRAMLLEHLGQHDLGGRLRLRAGAPAYRWLFGAGAGGRCHLGFAGVARAFRLVLFEHLGQHDLGGRFRLGAGAPADGRSFGAGAGGNRGDVDRGRVAGERGRRCGGDRVGDQVSRGCGIGRRGGRDQGDRGDEFAVADRCRRDAVLVRIDRRGRGEAMGRRLACGDRRRRGGDAVLCADRRPRGGRDRRPGDRRDLRVGRLGFGRRGTESGAGGGHAVAAAGASADRWVTCFGEQLVDAQRDAGQPLSSSAPAANEFDRHQHAERDTVEHAERARQHTQSQSDDRHDSMVPAGNRASPLIRT
ncbi:MAG TPA: hypothetical protein VFW65_29165 [Pseudonocardiaceae bacterium]|nr:hypothetical protein [Pseudonocardiaceae bacterium]